jgi:branched-chain amino acid transport system permease protein
MLEMAIPTFVLFGIDFITFLVDFGTTYTLYLVVSLSLNLEAGFAGVPNFGKVMFVAVGAAVAGPVSGRLAASILGVNTHGNYNAYIAEIITKVTPSLSHNFALSMEILFLSIVLAAGIGAALGYLASYPAIRLREDYLGMLLLASAQLFQIFLGGYEPLIGGTQGIEVPDFFGWVGNESGVRDVVILVFFAVFAGLVYFYVEKVARSPLGRTLRAVRDNEIASRSLGKNDVAMRRNVIIIASAISSMAGAFFTFYVGSVGAETWTRVEWTFWIWVMLIIGGAANNLGVAFGAFAFTFSFKILEQVKFYFAYLIPFDVTSLEYLVFASLLILVLVFRPGGILPERSTPTLPKRVIARILETRKGSETGTPRNAASISPSSGEQINRQPKPVGMAPGDKTES